MRKSFLVCLLSLFIFKYSRAQTVFDKGLDLYYNHFLPEKIYIHFDKSVYSPGETVFYKVYIIQGMQSMASSKTVYVDWAEKNGKIMEHQAYPIFDGGAFGSFVIPDSLKAEQLSVLAYTKWMMNFDSGFLFKRNIPIVFKNPSLGSANIKHEIIEQVHFFPEGGDIISGLSNRIAFKGHDQYGRPVKIKGALLNSKNQVVDSFTSLHDGMGYFFINATPNEQYKVKWTDSKNTVHESMLPETKSDGVTLKVMTEGTKRKFVISRNENAAPRFKDLTVLGTMYHQVVFKANVKNTSPNNVQATIETNEFPSGLLTITVFDGNMEPIAERVTFINNNEYKLNAEVGFKKLGLGKRNENILQVVVPKNIKTNLSVSVTDVDIAHDDQNNILSGLLLNGDINGSVYNGAYYFSNDSDSVQQHLDLVMLTHGWRRYNWKNIKQNISPSISYPKDTTYLWFSGRVLGLDPSKIRELGSINLLYKADTSKTLSIVPLPLDKNGVFTEPETIFFDTLKVYYSFPKDKVFSKSATVRFMENRLSAPGRVMVENLPSIISDTAGAYLNYLRAAEEQKLKELLSGATLQNVTVSSQKKKSSLELMDEKYASNLFRGGDAMAFDMVNDPVASTYLNVFKYLQGRVPGLTVEYGSETKLKWRGGEPVVYLDDLKADVELLETVPVSDIAYVKVLRPPVLNVSGGGNGAIVIYTRRGDDVKSTAASLASNTAIGYTIAKEFYVPNYNSFKKENEKKDTRNTLYWNPLIQTSKENSTVQLQFFNNDVTTGFRIILQGLSDDGRLVSIEKVIQ